MGESRMIAATIISPNLKTLYAIHSCTQLHSFALPQLLVVTTFTRSEPLDHLQISQSPLDDWRYRMARDWSTKKWVVLTIRHPRKSKSSES